ncbi:hypothetical protein A3735_09185 [Oleiphilus sp. HI0061]|nr:hypothetical protein A3735_09185 [Oleiphilus sp. HI0061]
MCLFEPKTYCLQGKRTEFSIKTVTLKGLFAVMLDKNKIPRVIAITGGKGGVGKTSVSINLAIALSKSGSKVCLLDGDTGLANTNIMLGLYPAYTLEHLFTGEKSIQDIVLEGPEGIQVIPGASGFAQCVELDVGQQQRLVTSIRAIEPHYDYMMVDTAAGISPTVLHFIAASQVAVVVVTPEPTSLTDAFSLLKVLKRRGYRREVQIVVNMVSNAAQAKKVFQRFSQAVSKYLDLNTEYLGSVWMDESMRAAVSLQRPVALYPKTDPSARCFYRLAEKIDDLFSQTGVPRLAFSAYWQKVVERQVARPQKSIAAKQAASTRKTTSLHKPGSFDKLREQMASFSSAGEQSQGNKRAVSSYEQTLLDQVREAQGDLSPESEIHVEDNALDSGVEASVERYVEQKAELVEEPLSEHSEDAWVDLRLRLNNFFSDKNTTPEQMVTLLSGCIYSFGDRLGNAAVDLLHSLLHSLDPDQLSEEQKQLLLSDYERIGLDEYRQSIKLRQSKARYDASGFGDQQVLARAIRSSAEDIPLESLLESIKYASLVDSSGDS